MSSSDLPACPACGSRRVHAICKPKPKPETSGERLLEAAFDEMGLKMQTFYACAQCGRDQTDAWKAVQPERRPEPAPLLPPDPLPPDPVDPDPTALGIAATVKS